MTKPRKENLRTELTIECSGATEEDITDFLNRSKIGRNCTIKITHPETLRNINGLVMLDGSTLILRGQLTFNRLKLGRGVTFETYRSGTIENVKIS